MSLFSLPHEVILTIVDVCRTWDIISWAQTSRFSSKLLLPVVYRLNIRRQHSSALFWAAENDNPSLAAKILQYHNSNINVVYNQSTPFICAAEFGSESVIRLLATRHDLDVNMQINGRSALWLAASRGHDSVVRTLLQHPSIQPDNVGLRGTTPFIESVIQGSLKTMVVLLQTEKVDINCMGPDRMTPILYALEQGSERVARYLLEMENINIKCQDRAGRTPLAYAVFHNLTSIIKTLLSRVESTVDMPDHNGRSPLFAAVEAGHADTARLLLDAGADAERVDSDGITPFTLAMQSSKEIVQLLLDYGVKVDTPDHTGSTALHHATRNGLEWCITLLLEHGANINAMDQNGCTPLINAIYAGYEGGVRLLLADARLDPNLAFERHVPIQHAAFVGQGPILRLLCNTESVDLGLSDTTGRTALNIAIRNSNVGIIDILLTKRAFQIQLESSETVPPLCDAAEIGNQRVVRRLLRCRGIDINKGCPLSIAAREGHKDIIDDLLEAGADINSRDAKGSTVLLEAIKGGHSELLDSLLKHTDVDVNAMDNNRRTPLRWAAYKGHQVVFKCLLNNPNTRKDLSYHPEDFCRVVYNDRAIYQLTKGTILRRTARRTGPQLRPSVQRPTV